MAVILQIWNTRPVQSSAEASHLGALTQTFNLTGFKMHNRGASRRSHSRRQCCSKNKTGPKRTDEITDGFRTCNVTPNTTKRFAQGTLNNIDSMRQAFTFADATAMRTIHANRMNFIKISQGSMLFTNVQNFCHGSNIPIHRVNALESHQLRTVPTSGQFAIKIFHIIVCPDHFISFRVANALNHRGMVLTVRQDHNIRNFSTESSKGGPVRYISRSEQKRCILAVQISQLTLK